MFNEFLPVFKFIKHAKRQFWKKECTLTFRWCSFATWNMRTNWLFDAESWNRKCLHNVHHQMWEIKKNMSKKFWKSFRNVYNQRDEMIRFKNVCNITRTHGHHQLKDNWTDWTIKHFSLKQKKLWRREQQKLMDWTFLVFQRPSH